MRPQFFRLRRSHVWSRLIPVESNLISTILNRTSTPRMQLQHQCKLSGVNITKKSIIFVSSQLMLVYKDPTWPLIGCQRRCQPIWNMVTISFLINNSKSICFCRGKLAKFGLFYSLSIICWNIRLFWILRSQSWNIHTDVHWHMGNRPLGPFSVSCSE